MIGRAARMPQMSTGAADGKAIAHFNFEGLETGRDARITEESLYGAQVPVRWWVEGHGGSTCADTLTRLGDAIEEMGSALGPECKTKIRQETRGRMLPRSCERCRNSASPSRRINPLSLPRSVISTPDRHQTCVDVLARGIRRTGHQRNRAKGVPIVASRRTKAQRHAPRRCGRCGRCEKPVGAHSTTRPKADLLPEELRDANRGEPHALAGRRVPTRSSSGIPSSS